MPYLIIIFALLLCSCTDYQNKNDKYYGYNNENVNSHSNSNIVSKTRINLPQYIKVQKGHSILLLSDKYSVNYYDVILLNDLDENQKFFKKDEIIMLPNYLNYKVKQNDNIYAIARKYNIHSNEIIDYNNLDYPYNLKLYQKIKIFIERSGEENNIEAKRINVGDIKKVDNDPIWPIKNGKVVKSFGKYKDGTYNNTITIKSYNQSSIHSILDGKVVLIKQSINNIGKLIVIKHNEKLYSTYAGEININIVNNQSVKKGQIIANIGNSNKSIIYFGIKEGRKYIDPLRLIKK